MDIQGIAAVVTGGASGLGEATARMLAEAGARVALFDMNAERGQAVAAELGGMFAQVDVSDPVSVAQGYKAARAIQPAPGSRKSAANPATTRSPPAAIPARSRRPAASAGPSAAGSPAERWTMAVDVPKSLQQSTSPKRAR